MISNLLISCPSKTPSPFALVREKYLLIRGVLECVTLPISLCQPESSEQLGCEMFAVRFGQHVVCVTPIQIALDLCVCTCFIAQPEERLIKPIAAHTLVYINVQMFNLFDCWGFFFAQFLMADARNMAKIRFDS